MKRKIMVMLAAMMLAVTACGNLQDMDVMADVSGTGSPEGAEGSGEDTISTKEEPPESKEDQSGNAESPETESDKDESESPEAAQSLEATAEPESENDESEEASSSKQDANKLNEQAAADKATKAEAEKKAAEQKAKEEADRRAAEQKVAEEAAAKAEAERIAAEEAARKAAEEAAAKKAAEEAAAANQQQGSQSNSTANVTGTTPATPAPTPAPTPVPHEHSWTPIYETRTTTVVVTPEWFEPEYMTVPIIERRQICDQCGATFSTVDEGYTHIGTTDCTSTHGYDEIVGYDTYETGMSIWHPAVTEERTEQVIVGYTCGCGATK